MYNIMSVASQVTGVANAGVTTNKSSQYCTLGIYSYCYWNSIVCTYSCYLATKI